MPFFAAIHKYRSGDDPATPNVNEAFDPVPHDILFMPLGPAGTNMRHQLYVGGFRPGEGLIVGAFYAELDRVRLDPVRGDELIQMKVPLSGEKDFLQIGGLFSVFTWRDISFTLLGIGIRPEDAAFDALEGFIREDMHIGGEMWDPLDTSPDAPPPPEPLVRSREWMRILIGMITLAPTEHISLTIGGAWIDPADHLLNILDYVVYFDARGAIMDAIGGEIPLIDIAITMDPLERFAKPFMDDPAMAFFMQLAVHF